MQSALEAISHYASLRTTAGPAFVDARNLTKVQAGSDLPLAACKHGSRRSWSVGCCVPSDVGLCKWTLTRSAGILVVRR